MDTIAKAKGKSAGPSLPLGPSGYMRIDNIERHIANLEMQYRKAKTPRKRRVLRRLGRDLIAHWKLMTQENCNLRG